ncbi:hypothetical protein LJ737_12210 [Hymenobacter sp. 15J16-1T3B]|uniref:hypothetical protein n=1 Tax=Hymenobacter sp. 15J16-1T3B TaxID=2886941 RepID=UPI001D10246F|nr:hypothetical protein [Hymenobacter sp. 15J16-1T3B]MCC3158006.1 hypothetical protein [Hymenobacter sp. 15J16-1T3B]
MKQLYSTLIALLAGLAAYAQTPGTVGIGTATPDPKAALDISSTDKGLLIPRLSEAQRTAMTNVPLGLMVFQTDGPEPGFWYFFAGQWNRLPSATAGDNLGNHTATQNLGLNGHWLSNDGSSTGLRLDNSGNVGVGVAAPNARLDLGQGALMLGAAIGNNAVRPAVGTARISGEISAYGLAGGGTLSAAADDGYLRLSAGGGSSAATKSFIDLAGFSQQSDVHQTIRLGTGGQERLRVLSNGNVGIGRTSAQQQLHVAGNIAADGALGIILAGADRPLITRAWDAFTSGNYSGIGRWGVFMEPNALTFGVPAIATKRFQWVTYNLNSTVASTLMTLSQDGQLQVSNGVSIPGGENYAYSSARTQYYMLTPFDFASTDPTNHPVFASISTGGNPAEVYLGGSGAGRLVAPVHLPQGATITNIELQGYDDDGNGATTMRARLVAIRGNNGADNYTSSTTAYATLGSDRNQFQTVNQGVNIVVDNAQFSYLIDVDMNSNGAVTLTHVRLTYIVYQAE